MTNEAKREAIENIEAFRRYLVKLNNDNFHDGGEVETRIANAYHELARLVVEIAR